MDILNMPKLTIPNYTYLGNLIPKNKLTLLAGLAGTGKTYSLIKFFNLLNICPLYVNLDYTSIGELSANQYDETLLHHLLIAKDLSGIENSILIIDTYQRFQDYLQSALRLVGDSLRQYASDVLEQAAEHYQCTIIVIGRPEYYVGKDGIFKDNPILVRNAAEYLHLDSVLPRGKSGTTTDIEYKLTVKKGRANGGTRIIDNWMREPVLNPLTGKMC